MAMTAKRFVFASAALAVLIQGADAAQTRRQPPSVDKYGITDEERAACTDDAITYCSGTYPDEDKLLACLKLNHSNLSDDCRVAFDAGIQRRHL